MPIVFVHGTIGHLRFAELRPIQAVAAMTPALLGYGRFAAASDVGASVRQKAGNLRARIEHRFGVQQVLLVGYGSGACICIEYVKEDPAAAAAMVLIEGTLSLSAAHMVCHWASLRPEEAAARLANLADNPANLPDASGTLNDFAARQRLQAWVSHQSGRTIVAAARSIVQHVVRQSYSEEVLSAMRAVPTALIHGAHSPARFSLPDGVRSAAWRTLLIADSDALALLSHPHVFGRYIGEIAVEVSVRRPAAPKPGDGTGAVLDGLLEVF